LLLVEPWIAESRVVEVQVFFNKTFATTNALCDRLASQFEVYTAKERIVLLMDSER